MITHWYGTPNLASLQALQRVQQPQIDRLRTGLGSITILDQRAGMTLSSDVRTEAAKMQSRARGHYVAIAKLITYDGFGGAIIRSLLTAIAMVSSAGMKERTFSNALEASTWLANCLAEHGRKFDPGTMVQS